MDSSEAYKEVKRINSIVKTSAIIDLLAYSTEPLSLSAISGELGMIKTTVHGYLSTLVDVGYVAQEAETGRYFLGYKLFEIGSTVSRKWNERKIAYPYMQQLAELTGNTIHLAVLDDGEVLYIGKNDSSGAIPLASDIGLKLPAHCTGVGKILLSSLPLSELRRYIRRRGLEKYTKYTITDPDKLQSELERIREQGYAIDEQEYVESLKCVAVPIYNSKGEITSALSIAGSALKIRGKALEMRKQRLLYASHEISKLLGYQGEIKYDDSIIVSSPDMKFNILVRHQGKEFHVDCRPSENVFRAISRSGYDWAWSGGCGGGGCGICKVRITAGTVAARRMSCAHVSEAEKEQGFALACCIVPVGDIELELSGTLETAL